MTHRVSIYGSGLYRYLRPDPPGRFAAYPWPWRFHTICVKYDLALLRQGYSSRYPSPSHRTLDWWRIGSTIRSNWSCCHCRPCPWRRQRCLHLLVRYQRRASFPGSYRRASSLFDSIDTFLPWSGRRCLRFLLYRRRRRSTICCPCCSLTGSTDPLLLCPLHTDDPALHSLRTDPNTHGYDGRKLWCCFQLCLLAF